MLPKQVTASVSATIPMRGSMFFFTEKAVLFSLPFRNFKKTPSDIIIPEKNVWNESNPTGFSWWRNDSGMHFNQFLKRNKYIFSNGESLIHEGFRINQKLKY
jgi:hypothetical protein